MRAFDHPADEGDDTPRLVAHLRFDGAGNVVTDYVREAELGRRSQPARPGIEELFGSWGDLDGEAILDELESTHLDVRPTPVADDR